MMLCRNCRHAKPKWFFFWDLATCKNPKNAEISPVTGKLKSGAIGGIFCSTQRISFRGCGPDAIWFERKIV